MARLAYMHGCCCRTRRHALIVCRSHGRNVVSCVPTSFGSLEVAIRVYLRKLWISTAEFNLETHRSLSMASWDKGGMGQYGSNSIMAISANPAWKVSGWSMFACILSVSVEASAYAIRDSGAPPATGTGVHWMNSHRVACGGGPKGMIARDTFRTITATLSRASSRDTAGSRSRPLETLPQRNRRARSVIRPGFVLPLHHGTTA